MALPKVQYPDIYSKGVYVMDNPEWIPVKEAAVIMEVHIESVRRLCRRGKIRCQQFVEDVSDWQVSYEDAIKYRKKIGRPRKKKL